jgi:hypothetical protein
MSSPWNVFGQAAAQAGRAVQDAAGAAAGNIAAGAQNIAAGAHNISAAASAGKLSVDPQTGQDMTNAINKMLDDIGKMQTRIQFLAQAPKLGSSPDAMNMANHSAEVGNGSQSAHDALMGLQQALLDLQDGIDKSMKNYGHTDQGGAHTFNQIPH